jgi:ATP/maltotriose-dependent transcriptional regulator MalT
MAKEVLSLMEYDGMLAFDDISDDPSEKEYNQLLVMHAFATLQILEKAYSANAKEMAEVLEAMWYDIMSLDSLYDAGYYSEAVNLLCMLSSLARRAAKDGADMDLMRVAWACKDYLMDYKDFGTVEDAQRMARELVNVGKCTKPQDIDIWQTGLSILVKICYDNGDLIQAENACNDLIDLTKRTYGDKHTNHLSAIERMSFILAKEGKSVKAVNLLKDKLPTIEKYYGKKHILYWRWKEDITNIEIGAN